MLITTIPKSRLHNLSFNSLPTRAYVISPPPSELYTKGYYLFLNNLNCFTVILINYQVSLTITKNIIYF